MSLAERNPLWVPIDPPRRRVLWETTAQIIAAYQDAEPVRLSRSQRYSLVVTEPLPSMVQR